MVLINHPIGELVQIKLHNIYIFSPMADLWGFLQVSDETLCSAQNLPDNYHLYSIQPGTTRRQTTNLKS